MALLPFRCCFHPGYDLRLGDHVFPSRKFVGIRDWLWSEGLLSEANLIVPEAAGREDLLRVHTAGWVDGLLSGTLSAAQIARLEIPYSEAMAIGFALHAGGSIAAAEAALEDGVAFNIGGGFHHAFAGHGEGFCAVNDMAVAVRALQGRGRIGSAMVIDTDVHQGNGTAGIFAGDESVFTMSIHQFNNYPYVKTPSDLDVEVGDGVGDAEYLELLEEGLHEAFSRMLPDLIAYVAGSDPYFDDQLGGLKLSIEGMFARDRLVASFARKLGVPVFIGLAGGYAQKFEDTVLLHGNTARALADAAWASAR